MPDLRYKRIGYVALDVTDRARSTAFQRETIGLALNPDVEADAFGATLLRSGATPCEIALYDGSEPGLRRVAFEMENGRELEAARNHLAGLGLRLWDAPERDRAAFAQTAAVRFAEPNTGLTVELFTADEARAPREPAPRSNVDRLGHCVVTAADPKPVTRFFVEELNFRVSDYIGDVAFLRCYPNPFHHSFAITFGNENRLNHVNFLVHTLDDYGQAYNRTKRQNIEVVFGPGRHPPSGSVFLYFLDPDAMTFEFSTGMEEFPETGARAPRRLPLAPESFDYWGGVRDPRHGAVGRFRPEEALV